MKVELQKLVDTMSAEKEESIKREERYYEKGRHFLHVFGEKLVDLGDALPERWNITMTSWFGIRVEAEGTEDRRIPKEELRLVVRIVEKTFGIAPMRMLTEGSETVKGVSQISWTGEDGRGEAYTIVVSCGHGDCKIRFEKQTISVAVLDDDCLSMHGKKRAVSGEE